MGFVLFFFFCDACCAVSQLIPCARFFFLSWPKNGDSHFFFLNLAYILGFFTEIVVVTIEEFESEKLTVFYVLWMGGGV